MGFHAGLWERDKVVAEVPDMRRLWSDAIPSVRVNHRCPDANLAPLPRMQRDWNGGDAMSESGHRNICEQFQRAYLFT